MPKPRKPASKPPRRSTRELKQEVKDALYEKVLKAALAKDASQLRTVSLPEKQAAEKEAEFIFETEFDGLKGKKIESRAAINANYLLRRLKGDKGYIAYLQKLIQEQAFYRGRVESEFEGKLPAENIKRIKDSHQRNIDFLESAIQVVEKQAGKARRRRH